MAENEWGSVAANEHWAIWQWQATKQARLRGDRKSYFPSDLALAELE